VAPGTFDMEYNKVWTIEHDHLDPRLNNCLKGKKTTQRKIFQQGPNSYMFKSSMIDLYDQPVS